MDQNASNLMGNLASHQIHDIDWKDLLLIRLFVILYIFVRSLIDARKMRRELNSHLIDVRKMRGLNSMGRVSDLLLDLLLSLFMSLGVYFLIRGLTLLPGIKIGVLFFFRFLGAYVFILGAYVFIVLCVCLFSRVLSEFGLPIGEFQPLASKRGYYNDEIRESQPVGVKRVYYNDETIGESQPVDVKRVYDNMASEFSPTAAATSTSTTNFQDSGKFDHPSTTNCQDSGEFAQNIQEDNNDEFGEFDPEGWESLLLNDQSPVHSVENIDLNFCDQPQMSHNVVLQENEANEEIVCVRDWLIGLGLVKYAPVFEIHEVDDEVLPMLTLEDLKEMGISAVGSRKKIYSAILKMRN